MRFSANDKAKKVLIGGTDFRSPTGDGTTTSTPSRARMKPFARQRQYSMGVGPVPKTKPATSRSVDERNSNGGQLYRSLRQNKHRTRKSRNYFRYSGETGAKYDVAFDTKRTLPFQA